MKLIQEKTFEKVRKKILEVKEVCKADSIASSKEQTKDKIIFTSDDDELNRKILEKLKIDVLLINLSYRKDFQKQRNSGFNQVMAKEAKKNNVAIGINLDEIIGDNLSRSKVARDLDKTINKKTSSQNKQSLDLSLTTSKKLLANNSEQVKLKKEKAEILARVKQNVKICSKAKLKMIFVAQKKENFKELHDLKALGLVLGMPTWMTKNLSIQSFFN